VKKVQLREAKTALSAVVDAAEKGQPTMITKRGRPAAVVVSHQEWIRLKQRVPSFADLLLAAPAFDAADLPTRRAARTVRKTAID
jgi:prevent-host-death family protein